MGFMGALLVVCAAQHILTAAASGPVSLESDESRGEPPVESSPDASPHNGTSIKARDTNYQNKSSSENNSSKTPPSETLSSKTPFNRDTPGSQAHNNAPLNNYPMNNKPSFNNAPYAYSSPHFSQAPYKNTPSNEPLYNLNPYSSQTGNVAPYNQVPYTNSLGNFPTPFNGLFLSITPYNSQPNSHIPFTSTPANVPPYSHTPLVTLTINIPLSFSNTPYRPFGINNPHNDPPFGFNNPHNDPPFGFNNPHNDPPFGFNSHYNERNKKNWSKQLRISDIKCRKFSKCNNKSETHRENAAPSAAGGVDALKQEFLHAAAVGWKLANRTDYSWGCAGSLISERFVLTAAHCTKTRDSSFVQDEPEIVRLGELDFTDEDGDIQDIAIKEIIKHPDYKWPSKYHDIALLRLATRAVFGDSVRPTCLWTSDIIPTHTRLTAIGWGALYDGGPLSEKLQKVYLGIVPREECKESYSSKFLKRGIIPEQLCAGDIRMDTCRGDSGGPLTIEKSQSGCLYNVHQIGVTSFGQPCGMGIPGVYTLVSAYLDWIEGHVWPVET